MKIGRRVKKLRKLFGQTQAELAYETGVSESTIRGVESCSETFTTTLSTLRKIMFYLGYNVSMKRKNLVLEEV